MKIPVIFVFLFTLSASILAHASSSGCVRGDCVNGFGEYVYPSGDSYIGYWNDGIRYGGGTYNFKDGSRFIGTYANNMRHGKGTYISASGQKMSGNWVKGAFARTKLKSAVQTQQQMLFTGDDSTTVSETVFTEAANAKTGLRQASDEVLLLENDEVAPEQKAVLEAEAMELINACTGYSADDIKLFTYLYTLPADDAEELYFRFKAYNSGSYSRLPGVLELTLKFRKYPDGVYEKGIDTGRYYWDDCKELS